MPKSLYMTGDIVWTSKHGTCYVVCMPGFWTIIDHLTGNYKAIPQYLIYNAVTNQLDYVSNPRLQHSATHESIELIQSIILDKIKTDDRIVGAIVENVLGKQGIVLSNGEKHEPFLGNGLSHHIYYPVDDSFYFEACGIECKIIKEPTTKTRKQAIEILFQKILKPVFDAELSDIERMPDPIKNLLSKYPDLEKLTFDINIDNDNKPTAI